MAKKTLLKLEYKPDYTAYGLFSPQKDYRLCWLIGQHLNLELSRLQDMQHTPAGRHEALEIPVFQYRGTDGFSHWLLIGNKTSKGPLFSEPRNMDYLLLIKGGGGALPVDDTIRRMRNIPQIQAVYKIDHIIDPHAGSFYFDLELFLDEQGD